MDEIFELKIAVNKRCKNYTITSAMRLNMLGRLVEMTEVINASLSLVSYYSYGIVFHYKQTGYKRDSNNEEFFAWMSIVNSLLSEFTVTCDFTGKITKIDIPDVDDKYDTIRKQLKSRYQDNKSEMNELMGMVKAFISDDKKIIKQLNESGFHKVLFSENYGKHIIDKVVEEKKVIENLVNGISVPVLLDTTFCIDLKQSEYTLTKNGALDMENFDKKALTRWLKDMTDTYNLRVDCGADIEEIFVFDKEHWLLTADSYFSFLAANLYECSYAYRIVQDVEEEIPENTKTNRWILPEK